MMTSTKSISVFICNFIKCGMTLAKVGSGIMGCYSLLEVRHAQLIAQWHT